MIVWLKFDSKECCSEAIACASLRGMNQAAIEKERIERVGDKKSSNEYSDACGKKRVGVDGIKWYWINEDTDNYYDG